MTTPPKIPCQACKAKWEWYQVLPYCESRVNDGAKMEGEASFAYLSSSPCVGDGVLWCSRTLSYRNDTILIIGVILANPVPMNASAVLRVNEVICHMNCNCVAPVCKQSRPRNGARVVSWIERLRNLLAAYPFTAIAERETPSGATVTSSRVSQYSRVTPVLGTSVI
jgi:hypothetical protein